MIIARRSSLLAFGLSMFCTFTTAGAVDSDPSHLSVPGDFNGDGRLDVLLQPLTAVGDGSLVLRDGIGRLSVVAQGWDPGYLGLDWSVTASTLATAEPTNPVAPVSSVQRSAATPASPENEPPPIARGG